MTVISVERYPYGRCETVGVLVLIVAAVVAPFGDDRDHR